jgi:nitrite reductase (NADH) large subunit
LRGALLYGDARDGAWYFELMTAGRDITTLRDHLLFGPDVALAEEALAREASVKAANASSAGV